MRKDSTLIFTLSFVLSLGIVGGAYYLYLQQQMSPEDSKYSSDQIVSTNQPKASPNKPLGRVPPQVKSRTHQIIQCTKTDGTTFWTNATRCEDADLDNRVSHYDPARSVTQVDTSNERDRNSAINRSQTVTSQRQIKPIPQEMSVPCSFPIGMARKIEKKSLRLKADPNESIWKESYCRWVCEARVESCGNLADYLEYESICPRKWRISKRSCSS